MKTTKQLFLSIAILFSSSLLMAQGFASFRPDGQMVETFIKVHNNQNSVIETIVYGDVDIANLNYKHKFYSGCSFDASTPLTNDFTRPQVVKVNKTGATSKMWNIIVHQLKPSPLPLEIKFSNSNPCDSLAANPKPWAGYGIDYSKPSVVRFGNSGVGFFVAYEGSAKELSFVLTALSKDSFNGEIDVETSIDGKKWKNLKTYSSSSPFENNKAMTLSLPADARYVRWVYALRERMNVNLNNISIK